MPQAYVNIGSNIGHRHAQIEQAVAAIKDTLDCNAKVSPPFYSSPQGFDSLHSFVNVGLLFQSDLDPFELLRQLQSIERSIDSSPHRNPHGNYIDRRIDIDLITFGNWEIHSPTLTLPHPRMHERPFVLIPLQFLQNDGNQLPGIQI